MTAVVTLQLFRLSTAAGAVADEEPIFLNRALTHVSVESAEPNDYLSICPNLCDLPNGELLIAYHRTTQVDFNGHYSTWMRRSSDSGKTWGEPRLLFDKLQAPGLLTLRSGELLLNGCTVIDKRWSTTMRLFRSADAGQRWIEQQPIWERSHGIRLQGGCASLIRLQSGRILCPVFGTDVVAADYGAATEQLQAWCYWSDDNGKNWHESTHKISLPGRGAMEPSVAELSAGRLVMCLRTQLGSLFISRSQDGGQSWSKPVSSGLEAPEAPLTMAAFPDHKTLLVVYCSGKFNPSHHHSGERTPLSAAIAIDEGRTWRKVGDIAGGPHEFGATTICFNSMGKVIIGYDWHRVAWDRTQKTGGIRLAIANKNWFSP